VDSVKVGDEKGHGEDEEKDVAGDKVGGEETHLDELDDELSGRLAHDPAAESSVVPHSRPPRSVRLVVLELSREERRDQQLVQCTLDRDRREHSEDRVRRVPRLEEPLEFSRKGRGSTT
jgi:hypothetical protein